LVNTNEVNWQGLIDLSSSSPVYYCICLKQPENSENQGRNSNVLIWTVAIAGRKDFIAGEKLT
jgi:hypothetical protein